MYMWFARRGLLPPKVKPEKEQVEFLKIDTIDISSVITQMANIFQINESDVSAECVEGKSYDFSFHYLGHILYVEICKDRTLDYHLNIEIKTEKSSLDMMYDNSFFYLLYAYYENEPFHLHFRMDSLKRYLVKLKHYIETDKLFYTGVNLKERKRYFFFNGTVKEIDYHVCTDFETEMTKLFGEEAWRIMKNMPVSEK